MRAVLRSSRVLVRKEIRPADILLEYDYIGSIEAYGSCREAVDLGDMLVCPGFIDLHSDAVEKEIEPRPGAEFPIDNALVELDKKLAMAGITTMFHAIAFNEESLVGQRGNDTSAHLIRTIHETDKEYLSVDNYVHARYEITSFSSVSLILKLMEEGMISLLSFMDHSPGQGQFASLQKWKQYHVPVYDLSDEEVNTIVSQQLDKKSRCMEHIRTLADFANRRSILIASHDDDTWTKIDIMRNLGVSIAEFPLNIETARYAKERGMATGMGAPNVVRGKSQSGNISARVLIENNCCDFLCSDYHPSSMLQGAYSIHREMGFDLAAALSFVTSTPAEIAGLKDRGIIDEGKLADLLIIDDQFVPKVAMSFKAGKSIYSGSNCFPFHEYAQ